MQRCALLGKRGRIVLPPPAFRRSSRLTEASLIEPRPAPARKDRIPLGIAYMLGATVLFQGSGAAAKLMTEQYPVGEILFLRSVVGLLVCSLFILPATGFAVFRTERFGQHVARGAAQTAAQFFILLAMSLMPLASAVAINFSTPLWATLAAILIFRERVGGARWAALIAGFSGVLIISQPGVGAFQLASMYAVINAVLYGSVTAGVRGMTRTESAETLTMYQMWLITIFIVLLLPFGFVMPDWHDAAVMVGIGIAYAFGQYWWTRALLLAPTSAVSPFYYFSLIWAIGLGYLVWGDVPTISLLLGSVIVVGSGLFLLWREARR